MNSIPLAKIAASSKNESCSDFVWKNGFIIPTDYGNDFNEQWVGIGYEETGTITYRDLTCKIRLYTIEDVVQFSIVCDFEDDTYAGPILNALAKKFLQLHKVDKNIKQFVNVGVSNIMTNHVLRGLCYFMINPSPNVRTRKDDMVYKDIRKMYPLGEYHNDAKISQIVGGHYDGSIVYTIPKTGEEKSMYTETFCKYLGMSGEETAFWILKYGIILPKHIHQL